MGVCGVVGAARVAQEEAHEPEAPLAAGGAAAVQQQQQGAVAAAAAVVDEEVVAAARELPQPDKFSVHLLVRAPGGLAFPSNLAVGAAVNALK